MNSPLIRFDQVSKSLGGRRILDGLSWELEPGQCAVILGPSGSGKTVFLNLLLGLVHPDRGRIEAPGLMNNSWEAGCASHNPHPDLFASVAVVFQENALLESRTVEANLAIAREERTDRFGPPFSSETDAAIDQALREVELDPAQVRWLYPSALSGGMQRRVALARALIRRPRVLVADEPTSGLDPSTAESVYALLDRLIRDHGMSAVIISHDPACAALLGSPVYFFSPGQPRLECWPECSASAADRLAEISSWLRGHLNDSKEKSSSNPLARSEKIPCRVWLAASIVDYLGRMGWLMGFAFKAPRPLLLLRNLVVWGLGSIPLVALIFVLLGVVMLIQAQSAIAQYGLSNRLPELVALGLLRLAPIMTGFLLAGRAGSALAAQIGTMELSSQFRALRTTRIQPEREWLPPIWWALVISSPLLAAAGLVCAVLAAGLLLSLPISHSGITPEFYFTQIPRFLEPIEWLILFLKTVLMGAGLGLILYACGSSPKRSSEDVSRAITATLVGSFVWMTLIDALISLLLPR